MEEEKEVTIIDLLSKLLDLYDQIKKKFIYISLFVILFAGLFIGIAFLTPYKYQADSSILLKSSEGGNLSMLSGLASQFGLGSIGSELDEEKFLYIGVSKTVIKNVLLKPGVENSLLMNEIINDISFNKGWEEDSVLQSFQFVKKVPEKFTYLEDSLFNELYEVLKEDHLSLSSSKEGIIGATNVFFDEKVSEKFNSYWVEEMSDYFIEKNINKSSKELGIIKSQVDSIYSLLSMKEEQFAKIKDTRNKVVKFEGYIEEFRLKREIEMLSLMFAEGIKNMEIMKFTLRNQTPMVEIIDKARSPLLLKKTSKVKAGILGSILGGLVGMLLLIFLPMIKNEIKKIRNES